MVDNYRHTSTLSYIHAQRIEVESKSGSTIFQNETSVRIALINRPVAGLARAFETIIVPKGSVEEPVPLVVWPVTWQGAARTPYVRVPTCRSHTGQVP
jgi:hypothetical protein